MNLFWRIYDIIYTQKKGTSFIVLISFLVTFIVARLAIYLMESQILPDWYIVLGQTHVHHLNYGIFLLTIAGYLSLILESKKVIQRLAVLYGVGLGLTFDEFALWFHLSDNYYSRLSYEMVVVIATILINIIYFGDLWQKIFRFLLRRQNQG